MPWYTVLAIYFIVWWLVFFTVLPFGIRSEEEHVDVVLGTDPGAPKVHRCSVVLRFGPQATKTQYH